MQIVNSPWRKYFNGILETLLKSFHYSENKYDSGYSYVVVHFTVELGTTSPDFDVESQKSLELKNWEMRN